MFRKLAYRFGQFMLGRRGLDNLGIALLVTDVAFYFLANCFRRNLVLNLAFHLVSLAAFVFFVLRFFSRNLGKREAENRRFMSVWTKVKNRFRDRKTHVYFKCPACKNTLRVPRGKGNITVTCPVCHEQIKRRT
ncbi:MAG: hypothetical protein J6J21_05625 [Clostridia bacterium]|nr:hypothetical protein [Clostridia bacterium]MBQ2731306.1 hypothetical protein [Clostridia bacterium]